MFFTVTAAPGTTSLAGLVTTPPIAPVVVDCAKATALRLSTNKLTKKIFGVLSIGALLTNELTVDCLSRAGLRWLFCKKDYLRLSCNKVRIDFLPRLA